MQRQLSQFEQDKQRLATASPAAATPVSMQKKKAPVVVNSAAPRPQAQQQAPTPPMVPMSNTQPQQQQGAPSLPGMQQPKQTMPAPATAATQSTVGNRDNPYGAVDQGALSVGTRAAAGIAASGTAERHITPEMRAATQAQQAEVAARDKAERDRQAAADDAATEERRRAALSPDERFDEDLARISERMLNEGLRDTSADEAAIRERMEAQLGTQLRDQRAGMGRAGFGASGATAALETDARRRASRDATEQILGVQQGARDDELRRLGFAADTQFETRQQAIDEFIRREQLAALQAYLAGDGPPPGGMADEGRPVRADPDGYGPVTSTTGDGRRLADAEAEAQLAQTERVQREEAARVVPAGYGAAWATMSAAQKQAAIDQFVEARMRRARDDMERHQARYAE